MYLSANSRPGVRDHRIAVTNKFTLRNNNAVMIYTADVGLQVHVRDGVSVTVCTVFSSPDPDPDPGAGAGPARKKEGS